MQESTIAISRLYRMDGDTKTKAFVDICVSGVIVKGLRVVEGTHGLFVSMPRHQGKDGRWYNTVYPTTKDIQQELSDLIISAYRHQ